MKEINVNLIEHLDKFQLICCGISCYQKKIGTIVVSPTGFMHDLCEKYPELPILFGKSVGKYGNCPSIVYSVPGTRYPTKLLSFPVTPTSLRSEVADDIVIAKLKGRFKPQSLICGWMLKTRLDMLEFSAIKLIEIINFYKLSEVAIAVESFGLGEGDEDHYELCKRMLMKYFVRVPVTLCYSLKKDVTKEEVPETTQSVVGSSYKEDTDEEEIENI